MFRVEKGTVLCSGVNVRGSCMWKNGAPPLLRLRLQGSEEGREGQRHPCASPLPARHGAPHPGSTLRGWLATVLMPCLLRTGSLGTESAPCWGTCSTSGCGVLARHCIPTPPGPSCTRLCLQAAEPKCPTPGIQTTDPRPLNSPEPPSPRRPTGTFSLASPGFRGPEPPPSITSGAPTEIWGGS